MIVNQYRIHMGGMEVGIVLSQFGTNMGGMEANIQHIAHIINIL